MYFVGVVFWGWGDVEGFGIGRFGFWFWGMGGWGGGAAIVSGVVSGEEEARGGTSDCGGGV